MRRIIASSLRFRFIVVVGAMALLVFGFGQVQGMPVDVFPEFAPPRVEVQTITLGLSAAEVESLVTIPLEQSLAGVEGLTTLRSKSVAQLSQIELRFRPGTDLLRARQLVQERISGVTGTLPTWASPPFLMQPLSSTSRVMKIGLSSDTVDLLDLSSISYWNYPGAHARRTRRCQRDDLRRAPGAVPRPDRSRSSWREHGVSIETVMQATSDALDDGHPPVLGRRTRSAPGGFVETPNQRPERPSRAADRGGHRPRPRQGRGS